MSKPDRRVERTRQHLQTALIELIGEKGYDSITVQDILDRASVGRSTFYAHFKDKEGLFKSSIENLRKGLLHRWEMRLAATNEKLGDLAFAAFFFEHVYEGRQLYRALIGGESGAILDRHFRRMLADMVRKDMAARHQFPEGELQCEAAVQYTVGGMMSLMNWWLDFGIDLSPEQVTTMFVRLGRTGIDGLAELRSSAG